MTGNDRPPEPVAPDAPSAEAPLVRPDVAEISPETFREGFGEDLRRTLDLDTWQTGRDLGEEYRRIEDEVRRAVEREDDVQKRVRALVLPKIATAPGAPKGAGTYECSVEEIARVHRGLLFNGGVEA